MDGVWAPLRPDLPLPRVRVQPAWALERAIRRSLDDDWRRLRNRQHWGLFRVGPRSGMGLRQRRMGTADFAARHGRNGCASTSARAPTGGDWMPGICAGRRLGVFERRVAASGFALAVDRHHERLPWHGARRHVAVRERRLDSANVPHADADLGSSSAQHDPLSRTRAGSQLGLPQRRLAAA